jgi:hypothetical protein
MHYCYDSLHYSPARANLQKSIRTISSFVPTLERVWSYLYKTSAAAVEGVMDEIKLRAVHSKLISLWNLLFVPIDNRHIDR